MTSNKNDVFVGSYTDSDLNSLSKKYAPNDTYNITKNSTAPEYDIGTIRYSHLTHYNYHNDLFYFIKFFNGSFGDFYSALPDYHGNEFFNLGDRILLGVKKSNAKVPYFVFAKNLTTGQEIDDLDDCDRDISDYQEFVVLGKNKCEQTEHPSIINEVIIETKKFGLLRADFNFTSHMPLYISQVGDKLLVEAKRQPGTNIHYVDVLRNITIDNRRSEFLLSENIR